MRRRRRLVGVGEPEIGYGYQQGGARARLSRWIMRRADVLATNSEYSRGALNGLVDRALHER